jgi:hypothetical protein
LRIFHGAEGNRSAALFFPDATENPVSMLAAGGTSSFHCLLKKTNAMRSMNGQMTSESIKGGKTSQGQHAPQSSARPYGMRP